MSGVDLLTCCATAAPAPDSQTSQLSELGLPGPLLQMADLRTTLLVLLSSLALLPTSEQFEPRKRTGGYNSRLRIKELCKDRVFNEYFREKTDNCAKVAKCDTSR